MTPLIHDRHLPYPLQSNPSLVELGTLRLGLKTVLALLIVFFAGCLVWSAAAGGNVLMYAALLLLAVGVSPLLIARWTWALKDPVNREARALLLQSGGPAIVTEAVAKNTVAREVLNDGRSDVGWSAAQDEEGRWTLSMRRMRPPHREV